MKIMKTTFWAAGGALLLASGLSHAIVSGDLLTNSNETTDWQNCDDSNLITDPTEFDPTHLEGDGCTYRETPALPNVQYTMTCGVSSFKYSSMTLAFQNDDGDTLATETAEIYENVQGGAYSITLDAPLGTTSAAIGIYGLAGSGFQDCTLLVNNPDPGPQDGSISGAAWFDENGDSLHDEGESLIPGTSVAIIQGDVVIQESETAVDGTFNVAGLDLGECYQVVFLAADPTLAFAAAGGDSAAVNNGTTADICLTTDAPNVTDIHAGFITTTPVIPPMDYAMCGEVFYTEGDVIDALENVRVVLINVNSHDRQHTRTDSDGRYHFGTLPAGDYKLRFFAPAGHTFSESTTDLTAANGFTPNFNLPADSNTAADDACTLRNADAILDRTPVALDPTVAIDDEVSGFVGDTLRVDILANDQACDGSVIAIDLIGHNVPGEISYDDTSGEAVISNTTTAGNYTIEYGIRGSCGSYGTATINVTIEEVPAPPTPDAPEAPKICFAAIGKLTGTEPGVHVDLIFTESFGIDQFSPQYNFYDMDLNLVYSGLLAEAKMKLNGTGVTWKKGIHGANVIDVAFVTAVENGLESDYTACPQQNITPIALDIDLNGKVETINGSFSFDMSGDGTNDSLMKWFGPNEGILVLKDFDAPISGKHLFGDTGGMHTDGFAKLALQDLNKDGLISGEELSNLALWTDSNSNASVDKGEISQLASHDIKHLAVEHYKYSARATLTNNRTLLMRDLLFPIHPIEQASK